MAFFIHREQQKPISFKLHMANIFVANPSTRYAMETSHIGAYLISTFEHLKWNKIYFVCCYIFRLKNISNEIQINNFSLLRMKISWLMHEFVCKQTKFIKN